MIMNPIKRAIATAGNDHHRLGANEAPPAIISVFGEQLTKVLAELEGVTQKIVSKKNRSKIKRSR
jgi:glutamine synthetase